MDKGVILMGEAAQAYIQYKYTELVVIVVILIVLISVLGFALYKIGKG